MENKTEPDNGAFARAAFYHPLGGYIPEQVGLTKREYFAAMAMQGLLSNPNENHSFGEVSDDAVKAADALIEALNENGNN